MAVLLVGAVIAFAWPPSFTSVTLLCLVGLTSLWFLAMCNTLPNRWIAFCLWLLVSIRVIQATLNSVPEPRVDVALHALAADVSSLSFHGTTAAMLLSLAMWRLTLLIGMGIGIAMTGHYLEASQRRFPRLWSELVFEPVEAHGFPSGEWWLTAHVISLLNGGLVLGAGIASALEYVFVWIANGIRVVVGWLLGTAWYLVRAAGCVVRAWIISVARAGMSLIMSVAFSCMFLAVPLLITILLMEAIHRTSAEMSGYLTGASRFVAVVGWLTVTACAAWMWMTVIGWISGVGIRLERGGWRRVTERLAAHLFSHHAQRLWLRSARLAHSALFGYLIIRITLACVCWMLLFDCLGQFFGVGPFTFGAPIASAGIILFGALVYAKIQERLKASKPLKEVI